MIWTDMIEKLSGVESETLLRIYWANGLVLDGFVMDISESCTCEIDDDSPEYHEYYMCVFQIKTVKQVPAKISKYVELKAGDLFEISEIFEPIKIEEVKGMVIWSSQHGELA